MGTVSTKRVRPNILPLLKDALTLAFWYKPDLRTHLTASMPANALIARLDWTDYKRNIVRQLVDALAADQHVYFDDLLSLILSTAEITDPSYLKKVEGGEQKYVAAIDAVSALREQVEPYRRMRNEAEESERRREVDRNRAAIGRAIVEKMAELRQEFYEMVGQSEQRRGYSLESFLNTLFAVFDIEAKGPFRLVGEQIDGAFTHESTEYLLEVKWQAARAPISDLSVFASKVRRKLDNTLGLFISMNGFESTAIEKGADGRPVMILMDGADLSAVLESRIDLPELLHRKRQHAARTGEIFIGAFSIIGE